MISQSNWVVGVSSRGVFFKTFQQHTLSGSLVKMRFAIGTYFLYYQHHVSQTVIKTLVFTRKVFTIQNMPQPFECQFENMLFCYLKTKQCSYS